MARAGDELRHRLATFYEFLRAHLPPPPARVLEVGCGAGELSRALARAGYAVTAIDPEAPEGAIFRRTTLEDFRGDGDFDAIIASVSLHHVPAVEPAVARVEDLLRGGGVLCIEEFAKERFTGATAAWYYHQRQARAAIGFDEAPLVDDVDAWLRRWGEEHADIHPLSELRRSIDARFTERYAAWVPYLFDYRLHDALEPLERALIDTGAIEATGFRYVGERRRT